MIDMRYKPRNLPQVSAPYTHVVEKLNDEGIENEMVNVDPEDLNPMQGIVFSDEVGTFDSKEEIEPIWISKDHDIVDGHHRFMKALMAEKPIECVKVGLNGKDTARVLNKIQDIFEYEEQQKMEEVLGQDVLNDKNDNSYDFDFINSIEETEKTKGEKAKVYAYRQEPILKNSVIGNFFVLEPLSGYDKYEIEFDNLLNTSDLGVNCHSGEVPIDTLAKAWFPNVDFQKLSEDQNNTPIMNLKNKAIAERAKKMGYDGIKYGDIMIQGLK